MNARRGRRGDPRPAAFRGPPSAPPRSTAGTGQEVRRQDEVDLRARTAREIGLITTRASGAARLTAIARPARRRRLRSRLDFSDPAASALQGKALPGCDRSLRRERCGPAVERTVFKLGAGSDGAFRSPPSPRRSRALPDGAQVGHRPGGAGRAPPASSGDLEVRGRPAERAAARRPIFRIWRASRRCSSCAGEPALSQADVELLASTTTARTPPSRPRRRTAAGRDRRGRARPGIDRDRPRHDRRAGFDGKARREGVASAASCSPSCEAKATTAPGGENRPSRSR